MRIGAGVNPPRLLTGLEVVSLVDGVAVVNGGPPVLFQGRAATELLVPLLNAIDGILNTEGLSSAIDASPEHVARGLQLLADRGLLETD